MMRRQQGRWSRSTRSRGAEWDRTQARTRSRSRVGQASHRLQVISRFDRASAASLTPDFVRTGSRLPQLHSAIPLSGLRDCNQHITLVQHIGRDPAAFVSDDQASCLAEVGLARFECRLLEAPHSCSRHLAGIGQSLPRSRPEPLAGAGQHPRNSARLEAVTPH